MNILVTLAKGAFRLLQYGTRLGLAILRQKFAQWLAGRMPSRTEADVMPAPLPA